MAKIEFTERTYEKYFGYELIRKNNSIFPFSLGLHDEFVLGFDEAFYIPVSWKTLSLYKHLLGGPWLIPLGISDIEIFNDVFKQNAELLSSSFKLNLFVQYKRPEFITRSNGKEWDAWQQKYFRYHITPHQHAALSRLNNKANGRASIVYSSPAFHKFNDLFEYAKNGKIIDHSNIVLVDSIHTNHNSYTYILGGNIGKAHSELENIESQRLEEIIRSAENNKGLNLYMHILETAWLIDELLEFNEDSKEVFTSIYSSFITGRQIKLDILGIENQAIDRKNIVYAMATISTFLEIYHLDLHFF